MKNFLVKIEFVHLCRLLNKKPNYESFFFHFFVNLIFSTRLKYNSLNYVISNYFRGKRVKISI